MIATGREVRFPDLPDAADPQLDPWLETLGSTLEGLADDGFDVVAHSLACLLWLHHATRSTPAPRPARVALISPPEQDIARGVAPSFVPAPLDIDSIRRGADGTVLVGSDNDPFCPVGVAAAYGAPLKMAATVIPGAGHINTDSGFGPFPAVLDWCGRDNLAFIA
ncbi:MAG: putative hydrolase [Pseudonocardiales bacterium]|nr:putative hydrolase [Pseudonocardiales bacterium]